MKKLLILFFILVACKKESTNPSSQAIPDSFYGEYRGTSSCNPSGGANNQKITIIHYQSEEVKCIFKYSPLTEDTLLLDIAGSNLTIPSQTKVNDGWAGGTYTIIGNGTYSGNQILLNTSITFSNSNQVTTCSYNVSK